MVSKQRSKQDEKASASAGKPVESSGSSFYSKQKMLESRIDKLRQLECKIARDTVCSKKNCPVSIDPRTTQERFKNEDPGPE